MQIQNPKHNISKKRKIHVNDNFCKYILNFADYKFLNVINESLSNSFRAVSFTQDISILNDYNKSFLHGNFRW